MEALVEHKIKRHRLLADQNRVKGPQTRSEWIQSMNPEEYKINKNLLTNFRKLSNKAQKAMPIPSEEVFQITKMKEEPQTGEGTRALFSRMVKNWVLNGTTLDTQNRNTATLGSHKPDVLLRKSGRPGEQSVRGIGEMKPMRDSEEPGGEFAFEQQGQLCDFLQTAMLVQPWRTYIYGFLTDCRRFEFYKASKKGDAVIFERSGVIMDGEGWAALRLLCSQDDEMLGYEDVYVEGWNLDGWLGTGKTSAVFRVQDQNNPTTTAVCKVYLDKSKGNDQRKRESDALLKLSHFPNVPTVHPFAPVRSACGRSILIKTPVGKDIPTSVRLPVSAYADIVGTLKYSHENNLFHNDIAPHNLFGFYHGGEQVALLNDFGSATTHEEIQTLAQIASRPLYYSSFGAAADLSALVRSVFVLTQQTFSLDGMDTAQQLDVVMRSQLHFWENAMDLASEVNYDQLQNLLQNGGRL